eukprot:TRINITY_DN62838_c0_g1_i1.p1 TRINITY_DN62838_c0_g1~~TRINITY_DN62838_c0_g1_i1.p1  ORF type:complete len:113 (-),score=3.50 TRINITY_DN62838_c0_g1_i1:121-459(-)
MTRLTSVQEFQTGALPFFFFFFFFQRFLSINQNTKQNSQQFTNHCSTELFRSQTTYSSNKIKRPQSNLVNRNIPGTLIRLGGVWPIPSHFPFQNQFNLIIWQIFKSIPDHLN